MPAAVRVLEILLETAVCVPCLEILAALDSVDVDAAVARLSMLLTIAVMSDVCSRCNGATVVYGLNARLSGPLPERCGETEALPPTKRRERRPATVRR